jgi:hypothetical protein
MAPNCSRRRAATLRALPRVACLAALAAALHSAPTLFAVAPPAGVPTTNAPLCGRSLAPTERLGRTAAAATATLPLNWITSKFGGGSQSGPADRLSSREWIRMYRTLGIAADSSRDQVQKATAKLRKKYANNEEAMERVESANLWITSKMVQRKEEELEKRQAANRMREMANSPQRLFNKYVAGWLPPSIRQMFEAPDTAHFQRASGLLGAFCLIGLCVPSQATNFVSLGAAACLGLVYQRGRPVPQQAVTDENGNVGNPGAQSGKKLNGKEMIAACAATAIGVLASLGLTISLSYVVDVPFNSLFCLTACSTLWAVALFIKVYAVFDEYED